MAVPKTTDSPGQQTVAVVGLGSAGIVAVKNLLEEGFDVTGFERNSYFGGVWHFTEDKDTLSVLEDTRANVGSHQGCFTDYPFPPGSPAYCTAKQTQQYLEDYVNHFGLRPRFRLNTSVSKISREKETRKWRLDISGEPSGYYDKVIMAVGPHVQPSTPNLPDIELFTGEVLHSRAFKSAQQFKEQRVLLVGLGNTSGDVADALAGVASSVAISHRHGAAIIPRTIKGKPASHLVTQRTNNISAVVEKYLPSALDSAIPKKLEKMMLGAFGEIDPAWGLLPIPSIKVSAPIVSDSLIGHLRSGAVRSVAGIRRIIGSSGVEFEDGTVADFDAIIFCTGYKLDFSSLDPEFDPSAQPSAAWTSAPGSKGRPLPRLYQNVFSLKEPNSLAFLSCVWFASGAFCISDLASMSIAQVWKGRTTLPEASEMMQWADDQEARLSELALSGSPLPTSVSQHKWLAWADRTAGAGVLDRLGWGWKGWQFWWSDRELWKLLMDGVFMASMWRLFDEGGRKPWDGARAEIIRMNQEVKAGKKKD